MLLLILVLIAAQLGLVSSHGCRLYSKLAIQGRDSSRYMDCLATNSNQDAALCILRSNSLRTVMECANINPTGLLYFLDRVDLPGIIPTDDKFGAVAHKPGIFEFTTQSLLIEAAKSCEDSSCPGLSDLFSACHGLPTFLNCLCCNFVNQDDISGLESHIRSRPSSPFSYKVIFDSMNWACCVNCRYNGVSELECPKWPEVSVDCKIRQIHAQTTYEFFFSI